MVAIQFNANEHEATQSYDPVPAGEYKVCITETRMDKNNTGITVFYDIIDGDHTGRKLFQWLGFWHSNTNYIEMANRRLSSLCRAVNKMTVSDTDELVGSQLMVKVRIQKKDPSQNDVTGHSAVPGFEQPAPVAAAPVAPTPTPAVPPAVATTTPVEPPAQAPWG